MLGWPWSSRKPNSSGDTMPPMLKPLDTKPNTLPMEPGGVTERTSMSRLGMMIPWATPCATISVISSHSGSATLPITSTASAVNRKQVAATRL